MSDLAGLSFIVLTMFFVLSGGAALVFFVRMRLSTARLSRIEPHGEGARIPLVAAFSGWKGIPWISWSSSTLKPTLILHPNHIECRVVRTRRKPYDAVSRVDYRETIGTNNIVLEFTDSLSSFVGNTASRDLARDAVLQLARRDCPLSPRAEGLLASGTGGTGAGQD
ncbi:hypothetical protein A6A40_19580 (plasmid) [Azospirillum humicireducens]|uniref:Uncharacterized protein n=1 Tax=Azospirillum humicireducens TaxID=1226968 RepID=A0A2R4VS44_9PROT|nr:hypothetical protein [Azospirillum humicireducens]AWB07255.1 hypothetical protein A6A40_19580 [Azospirillum humicireducens]